MQKFHLKIYTLRLNEAHKLQIRPVLVVLGQAFFLYGNSDDINW